MTTNELSNVKCELAVAYVRAVSAKCNFAFQETGRGYDGIGIDCQITNFSSTSKPEVVIPGSEIKLQIKGMSRSSLSMYKEDDKFFKYNIQELAPSGPQYYLVIMELPEEDSLDDWLQITDESMIMKRRAYYLRIKNKVTGFVEIPKTNLFNTKTLPNLFAHSLEEFIEGIK